MLSKKRIISAIADLGRELGRRPSREQFFSLTGINEYRVTQCFPTWNDAVRAAGLQPHTRPAKVEDRALLEDWGKAVRRNRGMPSHHIYRCEGKYSSSTIERRFGSWSSVPQAFRNFAKGKRKWKDVLALLPAPTPKINKTNAEVTKGDSTETAEKRRPKKDCSPILPGQAPHPPLEGRATYGDPIAFRWLRHEPMNEQGVVLLFGMLAKQLGYIIETVQTGFPDCEAKRHIGPKRWQRVLIEFEFESRNFRDHGHPSTGCDIIVCWRHNWEDCPKHLEVLELSRVIKSLSIPEDREQRREKRGHSLRSEGQSS